MCFLKQLQDLLDPERVSGSIVAWVKRVKDSEGVSAVEVQHEIFSIEPWDHGVEEISIIVQELSQVLTHRKGIVGIEEGGHHQDKTVRTEASMVRRVQVAILEKLFQNEDDGSEILEVHA